MRPIRIILIAGVRPQYIKLAALQRVINEVNEKQPKIFDPIYINAGQHYDDALSAKLIKELGIKIDYTLVHENKNPDRIFTSIIIQLVDLLDTLQPVDWVLIFGDAFTTLASAIAASRRKIRIVHIEAGVRSSDLTYAEEINRRMVSPVVSVHFCTFKNNIDNLRQENINKDVYWSGDLSYSLLNNIGSGLLPGFPGLQPEEYVLLTLHKPQNVDDDTILNSIISTLNHYSRKVLFVTHPRTYRKINNIGIKFSENIIVSESLSYKEMLSAVQGSAFIITDSGSLQREAYFLRKHCLIRRNSVGMSRFIDAGVHRLIGCSVGEIEEGLNWAEKALNKPFSNNLDDELIKTDAGKFILEKLRDLT